MRPSIIGALPHALSVPLAGCGADAPRRSATRRFAFRRSTIALLVAVAWPAAAQTGTARPPVIDVHVHSTTTRPGALARLDSLGVRFVVLAGLVSDLRSWAAEADSSRYLPAVVFPCDGGRAAITGRPCFDAPMEFPDTSWLRMEIRAGRIRAFGEVLPQFLGLAPSDPRLEPYWSLAEEFDLPVGIHMGNGPPGAAYETSPVPFKSPRYRVTAGDPLLLEDVLLRHKRLRVYVMHAGWPRLDAMMALLHGHPNVYVDLAALQSPRVMPRAGYERYLRTLVDAGFGKRIMFGSDFPDGLESGIAAIMTANFLTEEQKGDILCRNAARFLRLPPATCRP